MEVKINVDESMFKDILENELKALPKEKIQEVLVASIGEFFRNNNYAAIEKLIIEKSDNYYYGYKHTATDFTRGMINNADYSALQDVVDKCIDTLKANYYNIIKEIIADNLIAGLTDSGLFNQSIRDVIRDEICKINNPQSY